METIALKTREVERRFSLLRQKASTSINRLVHFVKGRLSEMLIMLIYPVPSGISEFFFCLLLYAAERRTDVRSPL